MPQHISTTQPQSELRHCSNAWSLLSQPDISTITGFILINHVLGQALHLLKVKSPTRHYNIDKPTSLAKVLPCSILFPGDCEFLQNPCCKILFRMLSPGLWKVNASASLALIFQDLLASFGTVSSFCCGCCRYHHGLHYSLFVFLFCWSVCSSGSGEKTSQHPYRLVVGACSTELR